jgi:hypothetical protein
MDPTKFHFVNLFSAILARPYDRHKIMKYIEEYTGGTTGVVVERWLSGEYDPSPVIKRGIVAALETLSDSLPALPPKIPLPIKQPEIIKQPPKPVKRYKIRRLPSAERIQANEDRVNAMMDKLRSEGKIT